MSASDHESPPWKFQAGEQASPAHEFNGLLTVLLANAEGLQNLTDPGSQARQLADDSVEAANRCIALTRGLETASSIQPRDGAQQASTPAGAESDFQARPEAPERILLVEDDDLLRDSVISMLESLGYQVIPAENGPHALALLDEYRDFDLLFTDVVMPGDLDGLELAQRARQLMPGLAILLTSGHPDLLEQGSFADVHRIHKPYRRGELATCLQQCFASTRSAVASDRKTV